MLCLVPNSSISQHRNSNSIRPNIIFKVQLGAFTACAILRHRACRRGNALSTAKCMSQLKYRV